MAPICQFKIKNLVYKVQVIALSKYAFVIFWNSETNGDNGLSEFKDKVNGLKRYKEPDT